MKFCGLMIFNVSLELWFVYLIQDKVVVHFSVPVYLYQKKNRSISIPVSICCLWTFALD